MRFFVVSLCIGMILVVKCCIELISTHSVGVNMHSINSSFFVRDFYFADLLEKHYKEVHKIKKESLDALCKMKILSVKVVCTDEKPKEGTTYKMSEYKNCNVNSDEVESCFFKVSLEWEDPFNVESKEYIVFFNDDVSEILFFLSSETEHEQVLYGDNKDEKIFETNKKIQIDVYFAQPELRFVFHDTIAPLLEFFKSDNVITIVSGPGTGGHVVVFFEITYWDKIKGFLKSKNKHFYNFNGGKFKFTAESLKQIDKQITSLKNLQVGKVQEIWYDR